MIALSGPVLTAAAMRAAELACGVPLDELMERAGAKLVEAVWRFGGGQPVLVLCGPGNNGGDGYVAARLLAARGLAVRVAASSAPTTDLARNAAARWTGPVERLADVPGAPVLIDALFGTGLSRPLDPAIARPLLALAGAAQLVIAADVPSGVGCDDGSDLGAAKADITITFGAAKPAHLLHPAAGFCGRVRIADIGIGCSSETRVLQRPALSPPGPCDHKYSRGMVAVVGGAMPGAAALAATAAARSGAGYIVALGIDAALPHAIVGRPYGALDEVLSDRRVGAVVIGPGLGHDARAAALLDATLKSDRALVIDGDALASGAVAERRAPTILTPHNGEFARVFGADGGSKIGRAHAAAVRSGATVIFKGADTVIA